MSSLNRKITQNKSKHLLVENELNKLKAFDSSYYNDKNYFEESGKSNYLIFQPISKYFKIIANTILISSWKSKGLSDESIKPLTSSDISFAPEIDYYDTKIW